MRNASPFHESSLTVQLNERQRQHPEFDAIDGRSAHFSERILQDAGQPLDA
jgi:hypothetical protein